MSILNSFYQVIYFLLNPMGGCKSCSNSGFINNAAEHWQNYYDNQLPPDLQKLLQQLVEETNRCYPQKHIVKKQGSAGIIYQQGQYVYFGNIKDSKAEQNGTIVYSNSTLYVGEFLNGVPHGEGALYNSTGHHIYLLQQGTWRNSYFEAGKIAPAFHTNIEEIHMIDSKKYKIVFKNGVSYYGDGFIKNNNFYMHGNGVFKDEPKNYEYDGVWVQGVKEGKCVVIDHATRFEGTYRNNKRQEGILINNDLGLEFKGKWDEDGKFTGLVSTLDFNPSQSQQYQRGQKK